MVIRSAAMGAPHPEAVEFVDEIPHTGTGKISKKDLRDRFRDYRLEA